MTRATTQKQDATMRRLRRDGLTLREIAARFGVAPVTVWTRVRGLRRGRWRVPERHDYSGIRAR